MCTVLGSLGVKHARQRVEFFSILNKVPDGVLSKIFSYATTSELSRCITCSHRFMGVATAPNLWRDLATNYKILLPPQTSSLPAPPIASMSRSELTIAMKQTIALAKRIWTHRSPENHFFHLLHLHVNWVACLQLVDQPKHCLQMQLAVSGLPELPPFDRQTLKAAAISSATVDTAWQCQNGTILDLAVRACCNIAKGVFSEDSPQFIRLYNHFLPLSHFDEKLGTISELRRGVVGDCLPAPMESIEISLCDDLDRRLRLQAVIRNRFEQAVATSMSIPLASLRAITFSRVQTMPQEPSSWLARSTALRLGFMQTNMLTTWECQLCIRVGYPIPDNFLRAFVQHFAAGYGMSGLWGLMRLILTAGIAPNEEFYDKFYEAVRNKFPENNNWEHNRSSIEICTNAILGAIATHYVGRDEPCLHKRLEIQDKLAVLFATVNKGFVDEPNGQ